MYVHLEITKYIHNEHLIQSSKLPSWVSIIVIPIKMDKMQVTEMKLLAWGATII